MIQIKLILESGFDKFVELSETDKQEALNKVNQVRAKTGANALVSKTYNF